jgi:hypothetical protein
MFDAQAIIAEATAQPQTGAAKPTEQPAAASPEAQATEKTPLQKDTTQETEDTNQETDDVSKKPDSELTPEQLEKREANRQSHLNRKLAKQRFRNENAVLKARVAELEQAQKTPQSEKPSPPKLADYDDLDTWVLETAKYLNKTENKTEPQVQQLNPADSQKQVRTAEIATQAKKVAGEVPEYAALVKENNDYLNILPESVQEAFLEADNAPLALYALMKEGRLEDLEDLSPSRIAMEVGRAEERGKAYLGSVKKATNTPPPIESLKGTGRATKDLDSMSVEDLMKKFNR